NKGADYCSFGEWVTALVLEEFARTGESPVRLEFEVAGVEETGKPLPCDEELDLQLYALQKEADGDCLVVTIRGKSFEIC
ncbi:MAG: hypothetical protein P8049_13365, partial [Gemmatimonadota bacterium]